MSIVHLKLIAHLDVWLSEPWEVGNIPGGFRSIIPIVGGSVEGPTLRGEVLGVGADWNLRRPDGSGEVSARYAIRTHDGTVISILNEARYAGSVTWPMLTTPQLEAPTGSYEWLNGAILTGTLRPHPARSDAVQVDLFESFTLPDEEEPS